MRTRLCRSCSLWVAASASLYAARPVVIASGPMELHAARSVAVRATASERTRTKNLPARNGDRRLRAVVLQADQMGAGAHRFEGQLHGPGRGAGVVASGAVEVPEVSETATSEPQVRLSLRTKLLALAILLVTLPLVGVGLRLVDINADTVEMTNRELQIAVAQDVSRHAASLLGPLFSLKAPRPGVRRT